MKTGRLNPRASVLSKVVLAMFLMVWLRPQPLRAADDILLQALRDELQRSMQKLQLANLEKPYFIAYTVQDGTTQAVSASFGSLLDKSESRARFLTVEVRIGDYAFDNTNFLTLPFGAQGVTRLFGGTVAIPLDDDYQEVRRQIWLATDSAYKKALEDMARKRAALRNKTQSEQLADFSKEEPASLTDDAPTAVVNLEEAARLVRELSAVFRKSPGVDTSTVRLRVSNLRTLYLNSEGSSFTRVTPSVAFIAIAATQATDGMPLQDFLSVYGHSMSDLPAKDQLAARLGDLGKRLEALRTAPLLERYNGPVLFEGQAAAELFSQVFAPEMLATRRPVADNPQIEMVLGGMENPFLDKLGARVLPEFLNVADNPTLERYNQTPLAVRYRVDDEGVRARETQLVKHGILATLLSTRSPVSGIEHSTGNRRGPGILPSNLIVTAENGLSDAALRELFLKLVKQRGKEYGIIVRRLGNPALKASPQDAIPTFAQRAHGEESVEDPIFAYKVFPDGREEL
ncbi:MAG: hypothetical protein LAO07_21400, partial [Acidobacteriia bacterium]|nr:hypothetical protein [Terriglobia bacterium]